MTSNKPIRILSFDPGLSNFGYSLIEYDLLTNHKTVINYGTITGKTLLKNQKELQEKFEKRYIILWELEELLMEMMRELNPDFVVSEDAFAHSYISAYAALILVIQTIRTASKKVRGEDIHLIAPKESKKAMTKDGTSDKLSVQDAILTNSLITIRNGKANILETLTEHACDSIAGGVAFIQNHLPSILASRALL